MYLGKDKVFYLTSDNSYMPRQTKKAYSQVTQTLKLLDLHHSSFYKVLKYANKTGHPVPTDTRAWSQILVSSLTGITGLEQKKGTDLADGSDVKAANCWETIDTPRFNGSIPAGRKSKTSRKPLNVTALNNIPHIYFVMWDHIEKQPKIKRNRIWCVRANKDKVFRDICSLWYKNRRTGKIKSDNFQLHPPRNLDSNLIKNNCGNFEMPLLFEARRVNNSFSCVYYNPSVIKRGKCKYKQLK